MPRASRRTRTAVIVPLAWLAAATLAFVLMLLLLTSTSSTPRADGVVSPGVATTGEGDREFTVSGSIDAALWPGEPTAIDVEISNPGPEPLTVVSIEVRPAGGEEACPDGSFRTTPLTASVVVPPATSTTLSALDVPTSAWPAIELENRPFPQDGCRGREITLDYLATGVYP